MEAAQLQSFRYWKTQEVEQTFDIVEQENSDALNEWLAADCTITEREQEQLNELQSELRRKVKFWNEEELKFHFLARVIGMIKFITDKYSAFLEAKLSIPINNQIIQGKVDFLVATGKQIPIAPFFTLHEYKPELTVTTDPLGQLLIALVAAKYENEKNEIDLPLYGTYVMGRFFFFVYFHKNEYAVSRAYDATEKDLNRIFCILKQVKLNIDKYVA